MSKPITEKQLSVITLIESVLEIEFEGETRQDAFLWIRDHIDDSKKQVESWVTQILASHTSIDITKFPAISPDYLLNEIEAHFLDSHCHSIEDVDRNIEYFTNILKMF